MSNENVTTPSNTDGNYHSFSDLEQSSNVKSDAEAVKEAVKMVESEKEPAKEVASPTKEAAKKELSENSKEENSKEISDTTEQELVEEIKKLEAKFGEDRLEIPQDALLKVTIDGKEQEVSLNELRNHYSGKVAWDKKFSELGVEKKKFTEEKTLVEKYVNEFASLANKKDYVGAMEYLAQMAGQNPLNFRRELRNQIINDHKQMLQMSEEQLKAFELKEENDFLKRQQESVNRNTEEYQTIQEMQNQLVQFQEAQKVSDEELLAAYDDLKKAEIQDIGIDTIKEYIDTSRAYNRATEAVQSVAAIESVNEEILDSVAKVAIENPDFTSDELVEIFKEAYPELINNPSKKTVSKKAVESAKNAKKIEEGTYTDRLAKNKIDSFYSFDEL